MPRGVRARARRAWRLAGVLGLAGCYTYSYPPALPAPGSYLSVDLNDQGRVDLQERVGPSVARVEGVLATAADSQFTVRVSRVVGLYGGNSRWSGEAVTLRPGYVRVMRERRFSRGRTAVLVSSLATALGVFILTRDLLGIGGESGGALPGGGDPGDN